MIMRGGMESLILVTGEVLLDGQYQVSLSWFGMLIRGDVKRWRFLDNI